MQTYEQVLEENRALRAENPTHRMQMAELLARFGELGNRIAEREAENARLRRNSFKSSEPPSSDTVKPTKPSPPKGQKTRGGLTAHFGYERPVLL